MNAETDLDFTGEPRVQDMLGDPIVHLLMDRDGWTPVAVQAVMTAASMRLGGEGPRVAAHAA